MTSEHPFFDEDIRIRDREIRELNEERRQIERDLREGRD